MKTAGSREWLPPLLLSITLLALLVTYAYAIAAVQRLQPKEQAARHKLFLLLACTAVFGLTLLLQPILFSDDVFTHIFSGRILAIYGANPLNNAPIQFPADPYFQWVISGRYLPNIYGPLWLCIASLLVSISKSPVVTLLLFKGFELLAHLINCLLVWSILGRIAPKRQLLGTLLYAWNPLVLIELAGSGHSEGVLLFLLLFAVWLQTRNTGRWYSIGALITFGLAISTNLIALLLAPLYIWFEMRTRQDVLHAVWGFFWRMLIILIPVFIISLPFWRGSSTFFAITSAVDMQHFVHSPVGTLAGPIRKLFRGVAELEHFPAYLQPNTAADMTLRASATFIFALIYINLFGQVRHAPTTIAGGEALPYSGIWCLFRVGFGPGISYGCCGLWCCVVWMHSLRLCLY
jgi:hypothetical protein